MSDTKFTTITIPKQLASKIKELIKDTGFGSASSFVTYILRQIVSETSRNKNEPFDKEDEEKIKARLKSLGYMK